MPSRTSPPSAGIETAASPGPPGPRRRADPRPPANRRPAGRARGHGRAHIDTGPEHNTPARGPARSPPAMSARSARARRSARSRSAGARSRHPECGLLTLGTRPTTLGTAATARCRPGPAHKAAGGAAATMTISPRGPNERLGTLLTLAQISNAGFGPEGQRPGRATGFDAALRQDLGGPVGQQGHGPAGPGPAPDRHRDRRQARPAGAAGGDRPRRHRPGARTRPGLPARGVRGGPLGHRPLAGRPRPAARPRRRPLERQPGRHLLGRRVRDARLPLADQPGGRLGGPRGAAHARRGGLVPGRPLGRGQTPRGRPGGPPLGLQVRWRGLAFVDGAGVPAGGGGAAAAGLVQRRGGPGTVRCHGRTHPAGRVDGLRHRPARGRPAVLHPGAAARPRRRRRSARRLRPGLDEPAGRPTGASPRRRSTSRRPRWSATAGWPPPAP